VFACPACGDLMRAVATNDPLCRDCRGGGVPHFIGNPHPAEPSSQRDYDGRDIGTDLRDILENQRDGFADLDD
jgi:hypothetical protein